MKQRARPKVTVVGGSESDQTSINDIAFQVTVLKQMTCAQLAVLYKERFGIEMTTHNAAHLRRKLAAKIQLDAIPPKEQERLEALVPKALEQLKKRVEARRQSVPKVPVLSANATVTDNSARGAMAMRDPRLPPVGTVLTKKHKATIHQVIVQETDFEWNGKRWTSLSKVAFEITGTRWNGLLYFGLIGRKKSSKETTQPKESSHV